MCSSSSLLVRVSVRQNVFVTTVYPRPIPCARFLSPLPFMFAARHVTPFEVLRIATEFAFVEAHFMSPYSNLLNHLFPTRHQVTKVPGIGNWFRFPADTAHVFVCRTAVPRWHTAAVFVAAVETYPGGFAFHTFLTTMSSDPCARLFYFLFNLPL